MHAQIVSTHEQTLLRIVRKLPPLRVQELVDFAQFLEFKSEQTSDVNGDERWEQLLATPESQRVLSDMAREALADYRAGRATDIALTEDGELAPA